MIVAPITFGKEAYEELKKVKWPTRAEITRLTITVLIISAVVGVFLGGIDLLLTKITELILNR